VTEEIYGGAGRICHEGPKPKEGKKQS